jgi:putative ATPase
VSRRSRRSTLSACLKGALALAQAVLPLAAAPKSNAVYLAYEAALADVRVTRNDPVPLHLRNAPTQFMKDFDFGKGYKYAHDEYAGQPDPEDQRRPPPERLQDYLPEAIRHHQYYHQGHRATSRPSRPG